MYELKPGVTLSDNALTVLRRRYLARDADGVPSEDPLGMFRRVADNVAQAERAYGADDAEIGAAADRFFDAMASLEFLPNSPTLMNAGRDLQQLAACFVLPVQDSIESIFDAIKHTALIHKSGGGTGFSFSRLRPKDDVVRSTRGVSSGPISFMTVFNAATEAIKQGGTRRGANMAILHVDHPDILEFIRCKTDNQALTNFNISVGLTADFMQAVESGGTIRTVNPRTGEVVAELDAREVFDAIVVGAWRNGEPGIIFLDRINADNPTPTLGMIESTNPCGEQPLLPYESCNLGSVNLVRMLRREAPRAELDFDRLGGIVDLGVRFLDDVIDANRYPLDEIAEQTRGNRKIGLGVMGWADALFKMAIPYDSEQAIDLARVVMAFIQRRARAASARLAESRGPFPNYAASTWAGREGGPVRNATVTTVAPTGTLSLIAGVSSGIEPLFALVFERHVLDGDVLREVHPIFERVARERGFYADDLMAHLADTGTLHGVSNVPEDVRRVFVCAHDVTPDWHIRMQAAFQQFTDNAVSKTVNFPNSATPDHVRAVFLKAYELGCKGVTVYRDGSREAQVLATAASSTAAPPTEAPMSEHAAPRGSVRSLMQRIASTGAFVRGERDGVGGPLGTEEPGDPIVCLECGDPVVHESGCVVCPSCGFSECP